jgi:pilin isopeptide linkage protein
MKFSKFSKCAASFGMAISLLTGVVSFQGFAAEQAAHTNLVSIAFEVKLEIDGDAPEDDTAFTFILDEDNDAPTPDDSYTTIIGEGTAEFGEIEFTKPGNYEYTIYEQDDGADNYTYDISVYSIDVNVQYDNNGQLFATYTAYSEESKEPEILFINLYDDDIPIPPEETPLPEEPMSTESTTSTQETSPLDVPETTVTDNSTESTKPSEFTSSSSTNPTSNNSRTTGTPQTGDNTNSLLWIVLLFVAVIGILGCMRYLNTSKNRGNDKDK